MKREIIRTEMDLGVLVGRLGDLISAPSGCQPAELLDLLGRELGLRIYPDDIPWTEQPLDGDRAAAERMAEWFGTRTMLYVLLDGEPLGGLAELQALLAGRP